MEINWKLIYENSAENIIHEIINNSDLKTLYCHALINAIQIDLFNMLDNDEKINEHYSNYDDTPCNVNNEQDYINHANIAKKCHNNLIIIQNKIKIIFNELTDEEKKNANQLFDKIVEDYGKTFCTH